MKRLTTFCLLCLIASAVAAQPYLVEITNVNKQNDNDVQFVGTVTNNSGKIIKMVIVRIALYTSDGKLIDLIQAIGADENGIRPGQSVAFSGSYLGGRVKEITKTVATVFTAD